MKTDKELADATHEGFEIKCLKCGSNVVTIESSLGFSAESGSWGSVDLICVGCKASTPILEG